MVVVVVRTKACDVLKQPPVIFVKARRLQLANANFRNNSIPYFKFYIPHFIVVYSIFHAPHFTLYTLLSTLYTVHFTLHILHFLFYTPHFTLHTLHFILHTLHSTLYIPHSTLYTQHFALHRLQCTSTAAAEKYRLFK